FHLQMKGLVIGLKGSRGSTLVAVGRAQGIRNRLALRGDDRFISNLLERRASRARGGRARHASRTFQNGAQMNGSDDQLARLKNSLANDVAQLTDVPRPIVAS